MLCFKICTRGLPLKIKVPFLRFLILMVFGTSLQIFFLRDQLFKSFSRFNILMLKDHFKVLKSNKITKIVYSPRRGHMDDFKVDQNS